MISHKCYSNSHVLMMRSKASKDSSRGFQVSSEISFLISVRKTLPTSDQTVDVTTKKNFLSELNGPFVMPLNCSVIRLPRCCLVLDVAGAGLSAMCSV